MEGREEFTEIEHGHADYSDEELLELSQFNAQALLMASAAAFGDDTSRLRSWTDAVGDAFVRGWDTQRSWEPGPLLDALLTNYRTFGANVIEADLAGSPATATIADYPDVELADQLGLTDTHADALFQIGNRLVRALGRELAWERDSETGDVTLTVS